MAQRSPDDRPGCSDNLRDRRGIWLRSHIAIGLEAEVSVASPITSSQECVSTTSRTISAAVHGRPCPRRALPSCVLATRSRTTARIVSGVAIVATFTSVFRPSFLPSPTSFRRSASVNRNRFMPSRSIRTQFHRLQVLDLVPLMNPDPHAYPRRQGRGSAHPSVAFSRLAEAPRSPSARTRRRPGTSPLTPRLPHPAPLPFQVSRRWRGTRSAARTFP